MTAKRKELHRQLDRKLDAVEKHKFTGKLTVEINCVKGQIGNYFSKAEAQEPNKILT